MTAVQAVSFEWEGPGEAYVFSGPVAGALGIDDAWATIHGDPTIEYGWGGLRLTPPLSGWDPSVVAASAPAWDASVSGQQAGQIYFPVLVEGDIELADVADRVAADNEECRLGEFLAVSDLDGDGVTDIISAMRRTSSEPGPSRVVTFLGPVKDLVSVWDHDGGLVSDEFDIIGTNMMTLGDLDGDGVDEILIPQPGRDLAGEDEGTLWFYSAEVLAEVGPPGDGAYAAIVGVEYRDGVGASAVTAGDVNGDGEVDIISTHYSLDVGTFDNAGRAWVWYGPHAGTRTTEDADVVIEGSDEDVQLGWDITASGDLNGDGCDDIATSEVGWPEKGERYGRVGLFLGGCE